MRGRIFEIKPMAVHDGPGIRTTVFFKGCPLRCVWCHNPEGLKTETQEAFYPEVCIRCGGCADGCLQGARRRYGEDVTAEQLLPRLVEDKAFYDTTGGGVTLSGGECLCQADFCAELLRQLKEREIHTAVDTCGFVPWESFQKVLPFTDLFLYDVKAVDTQVHRRCTGQDNGLILDNLRHLDALGAKLEIRVPLVPGWNNGQMTKIAEFLATLIHVETVNILPHHNYAASKYAALGMENTLPERRPADSELLQAAAVMADFGLRAEIHGA